MAANVAKDGVVDYPIVDGMPLCGIWNYGPNAAGAAISAKQGFLDISRGVSISSNQWTNLSIRHTMQITDGLVLQFDISYLKISVRYVSMIEVKVFISAPSM